MRVCKVFPSICQGFSWIILVIGVAAVDRQHHTEFAHLDVLIYFIDIANLFTSGFLSNIVDYVHVQMYTTHWRLLLFNTNTYSMYVGRGLNLYIYLHKMVCESVNEGRSEPSCGEGVRVRMNQPFTKVCKPFAKVCEPFAIVHERFAMSS